MKNQNTELVDSAVRAITGWYDWHEWATETISRLPDGAIYVELGCFLGKSTTAIAGLMKQACEQGPEGGPNPFRHKLSLHAVDLFELDESADPRVLEKIPDGSRAFGKFFEANLKAAGVRKFVKMIKKATAAAALDYEPQSVDVVFVDADHAYDSVLADILNWWPKLKLGGVMAGHDIHSFDSVWKAAHDAAAELKMPLEIVAAQNIWVMKKAA